MSVLLLLLALPAMGQKKGKHQARAAAETTNGSRAATVDPAYTIGPQDVLDINVWNEPAISRIVPVRPDGKISLPLLNDVQAAGLTPEQLDQTITRDLHKYLENPQVTVIVTAINSQRFYLLGEVGRPGTYQLLPDMTVLQALSDAGGFSPFAKLKDIYVLRTANGRQQKFPFNYKDVLKGVHPEENLVLRPGDTIIVP
ncbi:MAG TPA: polysaccharide biosynthesis/export family protein [Candidatus Dormibacteraeota bacterium]|nr:polysaccharide biosynthesis/export family protein [Candidatus Dormibacteraeota bacterium]